MSNTAPIQLPPALSDAALAKITAASKSLPPAFQAVVALYAPAVLRIATANANADITALYNALAGLTGPTAQDVIHANMSLAELEAEKTQLEPLLAKMAQDSYEAQQTGKQLLAAVFNAAIGVGLTAMGF